MSPRWLRTGVAFMLAISATVSAVQGVHAQQAGIAAPTPAGAGPRPVADHPLAWVLKFAHEERAYLQQTVRDFTCRVTKRERIDGELQDYHYIDMHSP